MNDFLDAVEAAECLLARLHPSPENRLWPAALRENVEGEETLNSDALDGFKFTFLSDIPHDFDDDDDEEPDIDYKRRALVAAIEEGVKFSIQQLNWFRDRPLQNEYLVKDLRGALRKHLTRLLARWYELEDDGGTQAHKARTEPKSKARPEAKWTPLNIPTARRLTEGPVLFPGSTIEMPVPEIDCIDFPWTVNFYRPEQEVEELTKPELRYTLRPHTVAFEEEQAIQSGEPSALAREVSLRLLEGAAGEALSVLRQYAEHNPYRSARLRSRVCTAIRAELDALVAEWDQVATESAKAGTEVGNETV